MVIGDTTLTTNLIRDINDAGATVCLLRKNLAPYASFGFENQANYLLRSQQYALGDEIGLTVARHIIADKIHNQFVLLKRFGYADEKYDRLERSSLSSPSAKTLLGTEGTASKLFFGAYFEEFGWVRRSPRTKEDIVNFMLDIGYTVLFNFVDSICRHFGLDTYKGVYHTQFFARRSLVCDLMEPFRCIIDNRTRTALTLKIVTASNFKKSDYGIMTDWKTSAKLTQIYAEVVLEQRGDILQYIQAFYRYTMQQDNPLPTFRLKR